MATNNTQLILQTLAKDFPNAKSELNFRSPYELIVAVILSAQCTDKRVNLVTPRLFEVAPNPQALADLPLQTIEEIIRPCGFYHSKATYLKDMAHDLVTRFGGNVPNNLDELQTLKGVGRKTANVVYAVAFGGQAIAVDTHVFRVSNRLGIANAKNVLDTEKQLMQAIPQNEWADSHHYILLHGRYVCKAQNPQCDVCSVQSYCKYYAQKQFDLAQNEAQKCIECKNAQCKNACPVANDIPKVVALFKQKKFAQAVQTIGHPFGEVCSYVCPVENRCQTACVLKAKGNGVNFSQVERTLFANHPFEWKKLGNKLEGKRVAVVGGGVSGLTFASVAYSQGASVVIYEKNALLATLKLIPSYRLPTQAIERIVQNVPKEVLTVQKRVDKMQLLVLQQQFDIVFVSTGLTENYTLGVEGESLATTSNDCLQGNVNGKVVVVGGGNTAIDCATKAKSLVCDVTVAYRRTEKDMPAFPSEIAHAKKLGVKFLFNVVPVKLQQQNGQLQLSLAQTVSNGRGSLTVTDNISTLNCNHVVCAVGGTYDKNLLDAKPQTGTCQIAPNVFVAGDIVGAGLVAKAVWQALQVANIILKTE